MGRKGAVAVEPFKVSEGSSIAEEAGLPGASVGALLRENGPRMAVNGAAPVLAFYLGWKLSGLVVGVLLATVVGVASYLNERRRGRPGMIARLALVIVFVKGAVGLASGSAKVYLAQPAILDLALGLVFLISTLRGKPFAGQFAEEFFPFPPEVKESATFKRAFSRVSIVWAVYLLSRSVFLLFMLQFSVDTFVALNVISGFPIMTSLMAWSVWYITRHFRNSEEWGWALEAGEAAEDIAADLATETA
ncbi:MAG: hypothetical protein JWP02_730 [Acidimicrobiales bacterium]|nr:hypothetical protein [Acidimicrobiales bacterium]